MTGGGLIELEVVSPSVEGDQLVGAGDFSVPLEDILRLEVRGFSLGHTLLAGLGLYTAVAAVVLFTVDVNE